MSARDSFGARSSLRYEGGEVTIFDIAAVPGASELPISLKILLENLLRAENGVHVTRDDITALAGWTSQGSDRRELRFSPARVVMQDYTAVPAFADLAAIRDAVERFGGHPHDVNPLVPVEAVVDHSVIAHAFGDGWAAQRNVDLEYARNGERYQFLRWAQQAFDDVTLVPPGFGIVHQVNLEHLARVVVERDGLAYPDTAVGTDSHTTMVNGLGVLAWGVGGIEAEAAMLGQPVPLVIPRVVGVRLDSEIRPGVTTTDLVLAITELLRGHGVVDAFVDFHGHGLASLPLAARATIANMSPEYGSTVAMFPVDDETLRYLRLTGRTERQVRLVEAYARRQGLWYDPSRAVRFSEQLTLDLSVVEPSVAGPRRPQDRIVLGGVRRRFRELLPDYPGGKEPATGPLGHGAVVIAAITSCTNTSNPSVMVAAGLLARNAVRRGLAPPPWVKTTLAPGSTVVTKYLSAAGLLPYLERLGFHLVGYGCTTCIGNSGPLAGLAVEAIREHAPVVTSVLSGNRNFEGRIHPDVPMSYLASPPLVVAYALAGTVDLDLTSEPLGVDSAGEPVLLHELWPSDDEVAELTGRHVQAVQYRNAYRDLSGDLRWRALPAPTGTTFAWDPDSTYVRRPPYLDGLPVDRLPVTDLHGARVLAKLGDSVTTDHIAPSGVISPDGPPGRYLRALGTPPEQFNSYGSRRGNHEVMVRGTFANARLRNELVPDMPGGHTVDHLTGRRTTVYDAAVAYRRAGVPLVVLAGKEYGTGSSRDWAAKGTLLLGIRVVIAESFERIHRSNLVGMGVLPLQFPPQESATTLGLTGYETLDIASAGLEDGIPKTVTVRSDTGVVFEAVVRVDTPTEAEYYRHGGILPYLLRTRWAQ